ncbi:MAG: DUF4430 domain-containing protein [Ruminococcus sp.]|nr:DUF4430 domain-containing protein [Ruminococcus sp.]
MKKTVKNTFISVLGASFIAMSVPTAVFAETEPKYINVSLRIEGISENLCELEAQYLCENEAVYASDIVRFFDESDNSFEVSWTESDYGSYISAVNGESEGTFGGWDGWQYRVNGEAPSVGLSAYEVSDGDEIVVYYSDAYGVGMQFPQASYYYSDGTLIFTSMDTAYDANWNPVVTENPVADMTVELRGAESYSFKTDESGCVDLENAGVAPGDYQLYYEKQSAEGIPLVLRPSGKVVLEYGYILGDVDNDGSINALDASMVLTAYANTATGKDSGLTAAQELAANVNNSDYAVNALDASEILSYYAYTATGGQASLHEYLGR